MMITYNFMIFFFGFLLFNLFIILITSRNNKNIKPIAIFIIIAYLMAVICVCFFPIPVDDSLIDVLRADGVEQYNNYIPFKTILECTRSAVENKIPSIFVLQIMGNILLSFPLGVIVCYFFDSKNMLRNISLFFLFTLSIEGLQMILNNALEYNYRSVDIDDIILNVIGGVVGYYFAKNIRQIYIYHKNKNSSNTKIQ